jgi:hypothetical protein
MADTNNQKTFSNIVGGQGSDPIRTPIGLRHFTPAIETSRDAANKHFNASIEYRYG